VLTSNIGSGDMEKRPNEDLIYMTVYYGPTNGCGSIAEKPTPSKLTSAIQTAPSPKNNPLKPYELSCYDANQEYEP